MHVASHSITIEEPSVVRAGLCREPLNHTICRSSLAICKHRSNVAVFLFHSHALFSFGRLDSFEQELFEPPYVNIIVLSHSCPESYLHRYSSRSQRCLVLFVESMKFCLDCNIIFVRLLVSVIHTSGKPVCSIAVTSHRFHVTPSHHLCLVLILVSLLSVGAFLPPLSTF